MYTHIFETYIYSYLSRSITNDWIVHAIRQPFYRTARPIPTHGPIEGTIWPTTLWSRILISTAYQLIRVFSYVESLHDSNNGMLDCSASAVVVGLLFFFSIFLGPKLILSSTSIPDSRVYSPQVNQGRFYPLPGLLYNAQTLKSGNIILNPHLLILAPVCIWDDWTRWYTHALSCSKQKIDA